MVDITLELDDDVIDRLGKWAKANGRSLEDEARDILVNAAKTWNEKPLSVKSPPDNGHR